MKKMTQANLETAFAGESQACMKYTIFAERAEKEGYPEVARLFRAVAYAERVHATAHLRQLGGIGDTVSNLAGAVGGENHEVDEMYPAFDAVAKLQEEKGAVRSIHFALEAEKIHQVLYGNAKETVEGGKDLETASIHVCPVCGHTVIGDAPHTCPVCGVKQEKFHKF
jgi:rubrerythrin